MSGEILSLCDRRAQRRRHNRRAPRLGRAAPGLAFLGLAALVLAACSGEVIIRGNMPDPELMAEISPGQDSRNDVAEKLGSPSALSTFMDNKWYYIGQKYQQFAFFEPDILERSVFVVSFGSAGIVDDTAMFTLEDGTIINPVSRKTPTEGKELTILQQFFGNLGRFPLDTGGQ